MSKYNFNPLLKDMSDKVYGHLTVVERAPDDPSDNVRWKCMCVCGNEVIARGNAIRSGEKASCGCKTVVKLRRGKQNNKFKHGMSDTPIHNIWMSMIARCHSPTNHAYKYYGGRGISVCKEWRDDFMRFNADIGYRPSPGHTLDRIDNDGNYERSNCRWATIKQQMRNKRSNRLLTHDGETHCVSEWAEITGIAEFNIEARINRLGWSVERALTTKVKQRHGSKTKPRTRQSP